MDDIIEKEGALVYSLSILQATFIFKPWRRQETTSAKMLEPYCKKYSSKMEQRPVVVLECFRCELTTLLKP